MKAEAITGLKASTLQVYASISRTLELLTRVKSLTFKHHQEVASLKTIRSTHEGLLELSGETDHEKIAELLKAAENKKWTVKDLRGEVRDHKEWQRETIRLANEPEKYAAKVIEIPGK